MGQQFCTVCGSRLPDGVKFCESCGAPVDPSPVTPAAPPTPYPGPVNGAPSETPAVPAAGGKKFPVMILAGVIILLLIVAVAAVVVLPKLQDGSLSSLAGQPTAVPTTVPTPAPTTVPAIETPAPTSTPVPDPFPDAYKLRQLFSFNEGKYASQATVYRYWMNDTYQWHSDIDNKYYTQKPQKAGNKYLLVFINIENLGADGYPYPKSSTIVVHNQGNIYRVDTEHYLPDKAGNRKATGIEIYELLEVSDYFRMERVEDYGYSHGTTQDFVYPGQGNAVDGYLIFEVPASLKPEETYVEIVFDGQDKAVWKLA